MFKSGLNCKGVTILEGLIALTLLALVATGTFSVLLSASRKSNTPDIREEMALAVDRAASLLQAYVVPDAKKDFWKNDANLKNGLCPAQPDTDPLAASTHQIKCLLPPICDPSSSSFSYTIKKFDINSKDLIQIGSSSWESTSQQLNEVTFDIKCNGFTL